MCTVAGASKAGEAFQKRLGKKNIKQMRKVDPMTFVDSTRMDNFWPVVDGYAIVDDQYKLYEAGKYNDVNVIMGFNSDEGSLFAFPMPVEAYQHRVRSVYGEWADRVMSLYPATNPEEVCYALSDIFRDGSFAWGTYAWGNFIYLFIDYLRLLAKNSSKKSI